MPGAVPRAWGGWLAILVSASASLALGQVPAPPSQGNPILSEKARAEGKPVLSEGRQRLEEMKVELALLGDIDAFPYSIGACLQGDTLQLFGFVPDNIIRQNVLDLARRNTSLKVSDGLAVRSDLNVQTPPRPAAVLQQEGNALLLTHVRDRAKQISLRVREDSVLVVTGRIDSMERKLLISRLFRQLSGCAAVDNQLTVEPIERNGQRMVQITRDGKLLVPAAVLGSQPGQVAASPVPPPKLEQVSFPPKELPATESRQPSILPAVPTPIPTNGLASKGGESSLPAPIISQQPSLQSAREPASNPGETGGIPPPKLPVKWGRPTESWEAQLKQMEVAHDRGTPAPQTLRQPVNVPTTSRGTVETKQPSSKPMGVLPVPVNPDVPPKFAETPAVQPPQMTWRRFGGEEHSEPRSTTAALERDTTAKMAASVSPLGPPLRSARRWPPAYFTSPPPGQGRTGTIVFAEEPQPAKPAPAPTPTTTPQRILPVELQRKVKALCGRNANDVAVSVQLDGSLLVRVKVANRTIEDQLSRQILAMPDMGSPRVRLMMEVGP